MIARPLSMYSGPATGGRRELRFGMGTEAQLMNAFECSPIRHAIGGSTCETVLRLMDGPRFATFAIQSSMKSVRKINEFLMMFM